LIRHSFSDGDLRLAEALAKAIIGWFDYTIYNNYRKINSDMEGEIITAKIAIFQKKEIRKTIYKNEWWFSVKDFMKCPKKSD